MSVSTNYLNGTICTWATTAQKALEATQAVLAQQAEKVYCLAKTAFAALSQFTSSASIEGLKKVYAAATIMKAHPEVAAGVGITLIAVTLLASAYSSKPNIVEA